MLAMARGCVGLLVMALAALSAVGQEAPAFPEGPPVSFLSRQGMTLMLESHPFSQVGLNKPDLLAYFQSGNHQDLLAGRALLAQLRSQGFKVLRVELFPAGPAAIESFLTDEKVRKAQLFYIDQMLQECEDHGMMLVCSLMGLDAWADLGHHSLVEAMINPNSPGRVKGEQYIRTLVNRYQRRTIIAAWEIGPQYNLAADLQEPQGPAPLSAKPNDPSWAQQHTAPIIRDSRNNITSDQLAGFIGQVAGIIRSEDSNHLISAGYAAPRREAMHLLTACRQGQPPQWHDDSLEEQARYLELIHPDPVDLVSINHFEMTPTRLALLKSAADRLGKPLMVSQIGLMEPWINQGRYDSQAAEDHVAAQVAVLRELKVPLSLYWKLEDKPAAQAGGEVGEHCLRIGATTKVLDLLRECNTPQPGMQAQP